MSGTKNESRMKTTTIRLVQLAHNRRHHKVKVLELGFLSPLEMLLKMLITSYWTELKRHYYDNDNGRSTTT